MPEYFCGKTFYQKRKTPCASKSPPPSKSEDLKKVADERVDMPNNCGNTVTIVGHEEDLDLFAEKQLAFTHFYPAPENADSEWCYEHWGTKWDPYHLTIERNGPNGIEFNFSTAWAPPILFLKHLLTQYPRCWIKITYGEPMMMVSGIWIGYMKNGTMRERALDWIEPLAMLTTDGKVMCDYEED